MLNKCFSQRHFLAIGQGMHNGEGTHLLQMWPGVQFWPCANYMFVVRVCYWLTCHNAPRVMLQVLRFASLHKSQHFKCQLDQPRVVQKVDNAIHRINHYPADSVDRAAYSPDIALNNPARIGDPHENQLRLIWLPR